jgi:oxamate amidohydrolase
VLKLESRFDAELAEALKAAGLDVEILEAFSSQMGHAGASSVTPTDGSKGDATPGRTAASLPGEGIDRRRPICC